MATTSRRNRITFNHDHSPFILERRRKLFPTEDLDIDSELGHISPLCSDTSSDCEGENKLIVQNECCATPRSNIIASDEMSPLILSPFTCNNIIKETPKKLSPSHSWKTPHDTSTKSNSMLKREQKTLLEESKSLKRKSSLENSPEQSHSVKLDLKNSKVRTALFPPDNSLNISLSTKSFYSKKQENVLEKLSWTREKVIVKPVRFPTAKHIHRNNRKYGQINNGVGHKIRKPKQKKVSSRNFERLTKNFLETGNALAEYIQDMSELKKTQTDKLISISGSKKEVTEDNFNEEVNIEKESQFKKTVKSPVKEFVFTEEDKENCIISSPKEDVKKKFFKSSRVKLKYNPCENQTDTAPGLSTEIETNGNEITFDTSDFQDDDAEPKTNIEGILSILDNNIYSKTLNEDAVNSTLTSNRQGLEIAIQPSPKNIANMILSPISQMCDVTSGLALNSPKKARNLTSILNSMSSTSASLFPNSSSGTSDMAHQEKVYPIFCGSKKMPPNRGEKRERSELKRSVKRFKGLSADQMLLDAGQKKFGYTLCNECNIVYHMGDPGDEIEHMNYHNSSHILRFAGWKNEHVVADFNQKGRIIRVIPTDSKIWLKKVKDLMEVVKRDLGCYEMDYDIAESQVFLYIKNRTIAGCVVATVPKDPGHKMLSPINNIALCSEETYPIKCGISHIWVAKNYRKQGIATALLDSVKTNFIFGYILSSNDIALTSPTEAGSAFAEKYFKTPNFLIYYI